MIPRERFLKAIRFEERDRVSTFTTLTPQVAEKLGGIFQLPLELEDSFLSTHISHTRILLHLGNDAVGIGPGRGTNGETRLQKDGTLVDEFGLVYQKMIHPLRRPSHSPRSGFPGIFLLPHSTQPDH